MRKMFCYIPTHNLNLVDSQRFFVQAIQTDIINTCNLHGLIRYGKISLSNPDVKKIFYHFIITKCCDLILKTDAPCIFCLVKDNKENRGEIYNYVDADVFCLFLNKAIKKIGKMLSLHITECFCDISKLCEGIKNNKGEALDFVSSLLSSINKKKTANISLQKAKKFAKEYELNFIDRTFLNQLSLKVKILT